MAIVPEKFAALCGSEPAATAVLDHFFAHGIGIPGVGGKRHMQIAVEGFGRATRSRWVVIRESALSSVRKA